MGFLFQGRRHLCKDKPQCPGLLLLYCYFRFEEVPRSATYRHDLPSSHHKKLRCKDVPRKIKNSPVSKRNYKQWTFLRHGIAIQNKITTYHKKIMSFHGEKDRDRPWNISSLFHTDTVQPRSVFFHHIISKCRFFCFISSVAYYYIFFFFE
jgi:hypothetical protein